MTQYHLLRHGRPERADKLAPGDEPIAVGIQCQKLSHHRGVHCWGHLQRYERASFGTGHLPSGDQAIAGQVKQRKVRQALIKTRQHGRVVEHACSQPLCGFCSGCAFTGGACADRVPAKAAPVPTGVRATVCMSTRTMQFPGRPAAPTLPRRAGGSSCWTGASAGGRCRPHPWWHPWAG